MCRTVIHDTPFPWLTSILPRNMSSSIDCKKAKDLLLWTEGWLQQLDMPPEYCAPTGLTFKQTENIFRQLYEVL